MEIGGNRRLVYQKAKRTGAVNGGAAVHLDPIILTGMVYLSCPQTPEDREPGRKKYSRKEKENAHFYIRKIKSIPPQKQAPEGFLEN